MHRADRSPFAATLVAAALRDDAGSAMTELSITVLVLVLMLVGVMECSRALYVEHSIGNAARDGARYAMVRGSGWSGTPCSSTSTVDCDAASADVSTYVQSILPPGITSSSLTISTTWPGLTGAGTACDSTQGTNSAGCTVSVSLIYPFTFLLPLPDNSAIHFSSTATMTVTQ